MQLYYWTNQIRGGQPGTSTREHCRDMGLAFPGEPHKGSQLGGGSWGDLLGAWLHNSWTNPSKHMYTHTNTHTQSWVIMSSDAYMPRNVP